VRAYFIVRNVASRLPKAGVALCRAYEPASNVNQLAMPGPWPQASIAGAARIASFAESEIAIQK
jgi:hypothetical protein